MVHTGVMRAPKSVRRSVTLPIEVARRVRRMAETGRVSTTHMLVDLVEEGIEARNQKEKAFFDLAERFRAAADPKEVQRLGDQLGRMVFER